MMMTMALVVVPATQRFTPFPRFSSCLCVVLWTGYRVARRSPLHVPSLKSFWSSDITWEPTTSPITRSFGSDSGKLSHRKDGRAMRPIAYGCSEKICESLATPTANFPDILMDLLRSIRKKSCGSASVDNRVRSPHTVLLPRGSDHAGRWPAHGAQLLEVGTRPIYSDDVPIT